MPVILDHGLRLPVHRVVRQALSHGEFGNGSWGWSRDGEAQASISYAVSRQGPWEARLRLFYTRYGDAIDYDMQLVGEPCRFGGLRWFAICPATGCKVSKLYLPPGARHFLARKAWRLSYASQNVVPGFDRLCDQRNRLLFRKLKSTDPDFPAKPKGMRWAAFERHLERLDHLHAAMDLAMLERFGIDVEQLIENAGNFDGKRSKRK
jgi:hypothetical protein